MNNMLYLIDIESFLSDFKGNTVLCYDAVKLVTAVQGLKNRAFPSIFLKWRQSDAFWLDYITKRGKFLYGIQIKKIESFGAFLDIFGDFIKSCGLCAWDGDVPATANVAATVCGVEGWLPVRHSGDGDVILKYVINKTGAEIKQDFKDMFTGSGVIAQTDLLSTGSKKCDAYLWVIKHYICKTNPKLLFLSLDGTSWDEERPYYPDLGNSFIFNHDYAIARRAFVFDLSPYGDEAPCDDPSQPLGCDLAVMKEILRHKYNQTGGREIITLCGFNPWQQKYTRYKNKGAHGEVDAEWRLTEILSAYNCVKDADAYGYCALPNASVYMHYPLKPYYNNRPPKQTGIYDKNKTYILFYVGDYDSSAWTARHMPIWYGDPALGKNPLMWCINPNLSDRIPQVFDFIYENFSQNDYFEAGDSGAGYINPRLLYEPRIHSDLPDGSAAYIKHNHKYFNRFDMHIIGFIINGRYPLERRQMEDIAIFADCGSGYNGYDGAVDMVNNAVFMGHTADIAVENTPPELAAKNALEAIDRQPKQKRFHIFRTILVSPTNHDRILGEMKTLRPEANFELVDPYTFFRFAAQAKSEGDL